MNLSMRTYIFWGIANKEDKHLEMSFSNCNRKRTSGDAAMRINIDMYIALVKLNIAMLLLVSQKSSANADIKFMLEILSRRNWL